MIAENRTDANEAAHMDEVDVHYGVHHPTEPDEEQVLRELFGEPDADGVFRAEKKISAAATGATGMISEARKSLGMSGRPNTITRSTRPGTGTRSSGRPGATWPSPTGRGTVVTRPPSYLREIAHLQSGMPRISKESVFGTAGRPPVSTRRRHDIVFFDWGASNNISAIDHVGVVEVVLGGGRLQTIEGNTDDAVKRRVRGSNVIAGYGRPSYGGGNWTEDMVRNLPELSKGDTGEHVQSVQGLLLARSHPEVRMTGTFDDTTEAAVKAVQRWGGVDDDGIVGPITWSVLLRVH